tara:strand:- start:354 stop:554 length:201 start_codon:yes stop_codon:yes gene_type:complete
MKEILYIGIGGAIGWWLALNKKEETIKALASAKAEAIALKEQLLSEKKYAEQLEEELGDQVVNNKN